MTTASAATNPATLAPVLGARRDGSARASSSRGLLMTVLGEYVLPHSGQAWTQTIVGLMEQLGVREKATRQALARMDEHGWLSRQRHGRRTRWHLTEHATALLHAGAERIYEFGHGRSAWDEHWVVLLASVPERDRRARARMGTGLSWAGFGSLGQGVWISPWRDQEQAAAALLTDLGIEGTTFVATVGQLGSGESLAAQGWDLPALAVSYHDFLKDTDPLAKGGADRAAKPDGLQAAADLASLVDRWRRFPFLDPELPALVLPRDWPRAVAVERFAHLRAGLGGPAREWWLARE